MDQFASIESSSGILKDSYDPKITEEALKRKRNKVYMSNLGEVPEDMKKE